MMLETNTTLDDLIDLVAAFAGLRLGPRDESGFRQTVQRRMDALNLSSWSQYHALLAAATPSRFAASPSAAAAALQEWHRLLNQLTIGESYFFRDERQFSLMQQQLIPELLAAKHPAREAQQLRVWSAGCATGEEAYSLAMLLREMGLPQAGWRLQVVGTDINQDFLAKAERGLYSPWSFRQTAAALKQRYFLPDRSDSWQIRPEVRGLTQFCEFNLAQDNAARLTEAGRFDLILCRNVFIYFTPDAIASALAQFYSALNPGGYLITGHAELQGIPLGDFRVRSFPASVVYQRPSASPVARSHTPPEAAPAPPGAAPRLPQRPGASSLRERPSAAPPPSAAAIAPLSRKSSSDPGPNAERSFTAALNQAKTLADTGRYAAAQKACEAAIALSPFAVEPCFLLANIAEETGDIEGAKVFLKRAIYLEPGTLPAYLELANLYDRTHDSLRADKTRRQALTLLGQMPPTQPVAGGLTVTGLAHQLKAKLLS